MSKRMKPLPYVPDFTVLQSIQPHGKAHHLELWNFTWHKKSKRILDYVVLGVDGAEPLEMLIASRPSRDLDPELDGLPSTALAELVPIGRFGLLAVNESDLGSSGPGGKDVRSIRKQLLASLIRDQRPWARMTLPVNDERVEFRHLPGRTSWLLVGAYHDITLSVVGRAIDVEGVRLRSTPRQELEQMVGI